MVFKGKVPGIYDEWDHCSEQVTKFSGNRYKGYKSREKAEARWMNHLLEEERKKNQMKTFIVISVLLTLIAVLLYLTIV